MKYDRQSSHQELEDQIEDMRLQLLYSRRK